LEEGVIIRARLSKLSQQVDANRAGGEEAFLNPNLIGL